MLELLLCMQYCHTVNTQSEIIYKRGAMKKEVKKILVFSLRKEIFSAGLFEKAPEHTQRSETSRVRRVRERV